MTKLVKYWLLGLCLCLVQPIYASGRIPKAAQKYKLTLRREAHRVWGLDAPIASFAAQVHQESRWRANARSPVGAQGLAQFMPATTRWIGGMDKSLAARAPYNPTWALRALVVYDKWLYQRVKAINDCERMAFAMSAYNGGLGWVYKRKRRSKKPWVCFGATCRINPGIKPSNQRENQRYSELILLRHEKLYEQQIGWGAGVCP